MLAIPETELHHYLADMFRAMASDYWVEVTHGVDEYGKDLVIVRSDPLSPDVIAVVVKRGDIRGKTAGDVDGVKARVDTARNTKGQRASAEIQSQIAQARAHNASLRAYVQQLRVTKVIVVLVGELSDNARKRLEHEVSTTGQVFDLPWLVDSFTDFYPQVFFDGRAVDFLDLLVQQLESDSFYSKTGKTLSECYVEPLVVQMEGNVTLDDASLAVQIRNKRIKLSQLADIVERRRRVLLVGDPGSGKSKALAKLCIDNYRGVFKRLAKSAQPDAPFRIPFLIPARRVQDHGSATQLRDAILPVEVRGRFEIQSLLVDGLDEVGAGARAAVLASCESFARELGCGLLITSRKIATLNNPPAGFDRYELLPFELSQALKLMQKVLSNIEQLPAIKDGLQKIQSHVPMNPLSLLLLVELVAERKEVPSSITELYDRYLDLMFGRWDLEKGIEVLFEYIIKKRFLGALAYHEFHRKNRLEIHATEFEAFVSAYATQYGWDQDKLRDFLKEIERAGILQVQDEVFFRHRSFLDFFVAYYVFEQRASLANLDASVADIYFDALWSEVAFFYAGLGREVSDDLLAKIFTYEKNGNHYPIEKLLSGRLLQAGWHSKASVRDAGVRQALSFTAEASDIADTFLKKANPDVPVLYGDLFLLLMVELSLGSRVLFQENAKVLEELAEKGENNTAALLKRVALLWTQRRFLGDEEHNKQLSQFLQRVSEAKLEPRDEARLLVLGMITEPKNKAVIKSVTRRLKRLRVRAPDVLKRLLPPKKKGFR